MSFDSSQSVYDIAAIIPMIEAGGGKVTFGDGTPIALYDGKRDILAACTPDLHAAVLDAISSS